MNWCILNIMFGYIWNDVKPYVFILVVIQMLFSILSSAIYFSHQTTEILPQFVYCMMYLGAAEIVIGIGIWIRSRYKDAKRVCKNIQIVK